MVWKHLIGQEQIKKHLQYLLDSNQVPHAQLVASISGYGNLLLALEFSLKILEVKETDQTGKTLSQSCQNPNLYFIYPVVKKGSEKTQQF